jgi:hypothetical protein
MTFAGDPASGHALGSGKLIVGFLAYIVFRYIAPFHVQLEANIAIYCTDIARESQWQANIAIFASISTGKYRFPYRDKFAGVPTAEPPQSEPPEAQLPVHRQLPPSVARFTITSGALRSKPQWVLLVWDFGPTRHSRGSFSPNPTPQHIHI